MKELNFNELLRYGLAGGVFILMTASAFVDPAVFLLNKDMSAALAAGSAAAALTMGSMIYALHRALPYPLAYKVVRLITGRKERAIELDIQRWKHRARAGALQPNLDDWAAQVHFLYCASWASFAALVAGRAFCWKPGFLYDAGWYLSAILLAAAVVHHIRIQLGEKRIFEEDRLLL